MGSKLLDNRKLKDLQPASELWDMYQPETAPHRFRARSKEAARKWQGTTRRALRQAIGFQSPTKLQLATRKIESVDKSDYVREKVLLCTSERSAMPVYLLLPKGAPRPLPVVVAFHGHGYGVKDIIGLWESGKERNTPDGYHKDFGVELCRRGFAVAAPEISCFGERQTDFSHLIEPGAPAPSTCAHSAALAFHLGTSVVGLRVRDGNRLIDYLETRPDMNTRALGAMGISGGGMHTFFSTCLDRRIKACVISGYYCSFRDSILAMAHCACNYVPGLHEFGEMSDLVGLIAPRPLLVEAGDHDSIFPIWSVKKAVQEAKEVYGVFGAASQVEADFFEGRHQISGRKAYDFLWEKLAPGRA